MRPLHFVLTAATVLALAACTRSGGTTGSPCLDRCTASEMTALEKSTCEMECSQLAAKKEPAPAPAPAPVVTTPAPAPAPTPAPVAQPRPVTPQPTPQPVTPAPVSPPLVVAQPGTPAPVDYAALQRQRAACETGCNAESSPGDRATCRLQCAQITDRPASTSTTPAPTGTGTPQPTADPAAVARCQQTCHDGYSSETDRATCRLNCSSSFQTVGQPQSYYVLHGQPPPDGDSRANVIRSSGNVAGQTTPPSSPPSSPPPSSPDAQRAAMCASQTQQCNSTCDTRLAPCVAGCNEGKMSATDRATCKLTCEGDVDVCRDDCRIKDGRCRAGQ